MKAGLFLVAFAVVAVNAEAIAQGGGSRESGKPDNRYARGFEAGWRDAIAYNGSRDSMHRSGYLRGDNARHETYDDGYKDGYNFGAGFGGSGKVGLGGISINGVDLGNPLSYPENAVNYQRAYQQEQQFRTQTRMAELRRQTSYRAHQHALHPHASSEELAAFSHARLPAPLPPNQFDPARGIVQWPGVLNRPEFNESREKLGGLFRQAAADPHGSGLGTQNYRDIAHAVEEMSDKLRSEIDHFTPSEYIAASKFLKSLAHQASMHGVDAPPQR